MQIIQDGAVIPEWTLGDRLRKAREHAGFSQTELGRELGVSLSSVSRYEIDRYPVPKAVLMAWAICTNCDLEWLLGAGRINVRYLGAPGRMWPGTFIPARARLQAGPLSEECESGIVHGCGHEWCQCWCHGSAEDGPVAGLLVSDRARLGLAS